VLTALALAGWGVRAAGTPRNDVARNSTVANAPVAANNGNDQAANNGDAVNGNTGTQDDVVNGQPQQAPPTQAPEDTQLTTTLTAVDLPKMGTVVKGDADRILYRFDKDKIDAQTNACKGDCQRVWPPLLVAKGQKLTLNGVDENLVDTIPFDNSFDQVWLGKWPLYGYIGDKTPEAWTGQKVGNTWFVSDEKGGKNLTCLPKGTPKAVAPPPKGNAGNNNGGAAGGENAGNNNNGGGDSGGYNY